MTKRQGLMASAAVLAAALATAPAGLADERPAASEPQAAGPVAPRAGRTIVGRSRSLDNTAEQRGRPCRRGLGHHPALACRARGNAGGPQPDGELARIDSP